MADSESKLNEMRDCVRNAYLNGCERGHEFRKMRHAIIMEFKRLGLDAAVIKDKLLEWNRRCERPLNQGEQRRQLLNYVDWVFSRSNPRLGCAALSDYCLGEENCIFHIQNVVQRRKSTEILPFDSNQVRKFLEKRYKADGYVMNLILQALIWYQREKATGQLIFIGYRRICSIIRDRYGHTLYPMEVLRKINLLIDEGFLKKVVKGKRGDFSNEANGYILLPWRHP